jgi:hypothetical protein
MGWALPNSPGHYLDLFSAISGVVLLLLAAYVARPLKQDRAFNPVGDKTLPCLVHLRPAVKKNQQATR